MYMFWQRYEYVNYTARVTEAILGSYCYRKLYVGKNVNVYESLINNKDNTIMFLVKYFMG